MKKKVEAEKAKKLEKKKSGADNQTETVTSDDAGDQPSQEDAEEAQPIQ